MTPPAGGVGRFPGQRRFAFTVIDDTDVATVANVEPIYRLLHELEFRTTKTAWPVGCPEGSPDYETSETLEDPAYRDFVLELQRKGFEIAFHGATMESSDRARTERGLAVFRGLFGVPPRVHANHGHNREGIYWGPARFDDWLVRRVYRSLSGIADDHFLGHVDGSHYYWGDLCAAQIDYVRNLTFQEINLLRLNPSMPYRDPRRPLVRRWFSASDAEEVGAFNRLLTDANQDRLEVEEGVCIVATHFGKGFVTDGAVNRETERLLRRLAGKPGWFVPVSELLDWLATQRSDDLLSADEWRHMQRSWIWDLLRRKIRGRLRPHRSF